MPIFLFRDLSIECGRRLRRTQNEGPGEDTEELCESGKGRAIDRRMSIENEATETYRMSVMSANTGIRSVRLGKQIGEYLRLECF